MNNREGTSKEIEDLAKRIVPVLCDGGVVEASVFGSFTRGEAQPAIKRYTAGLTKESFFSSTEKQDAIYRRLEVIGEAANRLPDEFRNRYSLTL